MIKHVTGNLLEADAQALVNTVNTVGVMGKGIALQFRQAFPQNYEEYRKACAAGEVVPGHMFVYATGTFTNPRYIINFPTKRHWKGKTKIEDIHSGLDGLIKTIEAFEIKSIAVPPLGCGNGGLRWEQVRPMIESAFVGLPDVLVLLYAPDGAPQAEQMRTATPRPKMTAGRGALLAALETYALPGYRLSMLEVQKIAYFLQVAGQPLKLEFTKERYGPYTETLHHVLQRIEGHFIKGYGDRTQRAAAATITLLPGATEEAATFFKNDVETLDHLDRVTRLIEGFEYPYGLELLATVHWVAQETPSACADAEAAVQGVHAWNERKRKEFTPEHIKLAWERLQEQGWLQENS
jgi:O-acetyl-ADP-ribose deacetylase (regulator of RNase III)